VRDLSAAGTDAFDVSVAADRQGNATLAWDDGTIRTRFRPAGGDWGPISPVSTGSIFSGPSLAVGDNGGAVVGWWRSTAGAVSHVEAAVRPPGGTFGAPLAVSVVDGGSQPCEVPRVAIDAAGDAVALWTRRTPGPNSQYHVESAAKLAGQANWSAWETRSAAAGGYSDCNIDLHITPGGRATAMWDFLETGNPTKYVAYSDSSAPFAGPAWSDQAKLSDPNVTSIQPVFALDDFGNTAATWVTNPIDPNPEMLSSVRPAGGSFTAPQTLSRATVPQHRGQAVAASANRDAIAVFMSTVNGNPAVFAARRTGGGAFAPAKAIATTSPGVADIGSPDVALDSQGNAFAAFVASDAAGNGAVQVAPFDPVPPVITAANVPATATTGVPVGMSAAASDRMSGAALHFAFGDGGAADGGAVAHIYAAPGTYTVTVTATDGAGNASAVARTIVVSNPPPPPPPPPGTLLTVVSLSWDRLPNGNTRLKKLIVEGLQGPETVRLTCKGKGCRKTATGTFRKHGTRLVLTKRIKGMTLRPKAKLTIATTRPGFIPRTITYTMVRHRDPKKATRCLPPGATKTRAC
jgi:hypothetical protein